MVGLVVVIILVILFLSGKFVLFFFFFFVTDHIIICNAGKGLTKDIHVLDLRWECGVHILVL